MFAFPIRIYYEDTDAAGVVYYAGYLRFMERARTEWLRALGFEIDELARDHGVVFVVRSVKIDFLRPARLNDRVDVTVELARAAGASFQVGQRIMRASTLLCDADVRIACLAADTFSPRRLPAPILTELNAWKTP